MSTVHLATSVQERPFSVLGFTTALFKQPLGQQSLSKLDGHFAKAGSTKLDLGQSADDKSVFPALVNGMNAGVAGGPVVGERGEVVGFLIRRPGGSPSDLSLVDPATIWAALAAAKIIPHSGPTDSAYESAMHNYKNKLYSAAIPSLTQTLKLYPGHALATEALALANQKKGTAEDLTDRAPPGTEASATDQAGFPRTVVALALAAIALIVLAVAIVLWLRRRRAAATPTSPAGGPPPVLVPTSRQSSSTHPGIGTVRRQTTVLRSRPVVTGASGAPTAGGRDAGSDCPVCGTPVPPTQTFCGQCGQRLG
jgi:zinc-ribbon domain